MMSIMKWYSTQHVMLVEAMSQLDGGHRAFFFKEGLFLECKLKAFHMSFAPYIDDTTPIINTFTNMIGLLPESEGTLNEEVSEIVMSLVSSNCFEDFEPVDDDEDESIDEDYYDSDGICVNDVIDNFHL